MSGRLPAWFAEWLPLPPGTDGAMWQLDSRWTWAPWATLLLVLLAIVWTVAIYRREQSHAGWLYRSMLVALRLTAVAAIFVMLAQLAIAIHLTGPPTLALVIDRSASMSIVDRYEDAELSPRISSQLKSSGLSKASRLDFAELILAQDNGRWINELQNRYRLEIYLVSDQVERLPDSTANDDTLKRTLKALSGTASQQNATRLGDAVRRVLADHRGQPPATMILLTDGVTTAGVPLADAAQEARRKGVPLMNIGIGNEEGPRDIEIVDVLVDDSVFVGDLVSLQVRLKASGLAGQEAKVTLRREDATNPDSEGQNAQSTAQEQTVVLPSTGEILSLQLLDRPTAAGEATYQIEVAARDDETKVDNNRQARKVAVRDDKIRVLLANGYPNYEFRFLKSLLERDTSIELATYLQDADPEFAEQDKTAIRNFPISRDEVFSYDVLLIGDLDPRLLPPSVWPHVRAFVIEKGGGAAFIAGPRSLPRHYAEIADVRALLPIEIGSSSAASVLAGEFLVGEFPVQPTTIGMQTPAMQLGDTPEETSAIWQQLAPQFWVTNCGQLKPAAQVLAAARLHSGEGGSNDTAPAICFQYVGAGRVLFHAIDSTWLWRRGTGDSYFARYWVQIIRYLARGKLTAGRGVSLATDRREYRGGEPVQLRARFLDPKLIPSGDTAVVSIESPAQPRRQLSLRRNPSAAGVFEGTLADLPAGGYHVLLTEPQAPGNPPEARFAVVAPPGELSRPEMDRTALVAAAETTRGHFYTLADAEKLLSELPPGRPVPIANLPPVEIWNRWWLISVFLVCLVCEWILRKRKGML